MIGAIRAAHDDVLDPSPVATRQVDPRLHAEGHPSSQELGVAVHEIRILVALQADAVAGSMEEVLAVAPASMMSRAVRSTASAAMPGRTAAVAAAWASSRTAKRWRNSSVGPFAASPPVTHSVRVVSLP